MSDDIRKFASINQKEEMIYAPFKPDEEAPYIFVSYSHADRDRVFPIITKLYERGWRVWYDEGLELGKDWRTELEQHICGCEVFLLFLTFNSVISKDVAERELILASDNGKRIVICTLDEGAEFCSEEAKNIISAINYAAASRKRHPRTNEAGLESVLKSISVLTRVEPRKAKGYEIKSNNLIVIEPPEENDEYDFVQCVGGVKLLEYNGNEEIVVIPEVYKGQLVVALDGTFLANNSARIIYVPSTVKYIGRETFSCSSLTDVYIPSSVNDIDLYAFGVFDEYSGDGNVTFCSVHCIENTVVHQYAKKVNFLTHVDILTVVLDNSIKASNNTNYPFTDKYAFCSYAEDKKIEAEQIVSNLMQNGCSVELSALMTGEEKLNAILNAECIIVFISQGYIAGKEIIYLRASRNMQKKCILYNLDGISLPDDLKNMNEEQQLRFDNGTENDRLNKLRAFLTDCGCIIPLADIPNFEYTTDIDGDIIITRYIGKDKEVFVPYEHAGHPIIEIGLETFMGCDNITSITVPDSVDCYASFSDCKSLEEIKVYTVDDSKYYAKSRGNNITVIDGVIVDNNGEKLTYFPNGRRGSYIVPNSVKIIGDSAFKECSLSSVSIGENVTSISLFAFERSHSLKYVTIPNSVYAGARAERARR